MITPEAPAQFEGRTGDGRPVYVRYRSGWLSVEVGLPGDSQDALPGGGYVVFEDRLALHSRNAISWDEVQARIAKADLLGGLARLEEAERSYRVRWDGLFKGIRLRELPELKLWTLSLAGIPWATPWQNRVGRFDFESAMAGFCRDGICAYVFAEPELEACVITVLNSGEAPGRWNAMDLAVAGAHAFGGVRHGPSGGAGRGEAEGLRLGEAEEAFDLVADQLRG